MLALGWAVGFGLIAARSAARLERSAVVWFVFGAVLGPVALVLLWLAPPAWCRTCLMPSRGMLATCWWCGTRFRGGPSPAMASGIASVATAPGGPVAYAEPRPDRPNHAHPVRAVDLGTRVASVSLATPAPSPPSGAPPPGAPLEKDAPAAPDAVPMMDPPTRRASRRRSNQPTRSRPSRTDGKAAGDRGSVPVTAEPIEPITRVDTSAAPPAPTAIAVERPPTIVATGVYLSGTVKLELGGRYGFMIDGSRFRILGPLSPSIVALDRPLAGMTVSTAHGRLLLAVPGNKSDELMVFTSVVGASPEKVAEAILQAVSQSVGP